MRYSEMPFAIKDAVEQYHTANEAVEDCLDALVALCGGHEAPIRALAEAYAGYYADRKKEKDFLRERNLSDEDIHLLSCQYVCKY